MLAAAVPPTPGQLTEAQSACWAQPLAALEEESASAEPDDQAAAAEYFECCASDSCSESYSAESRPVSPVNEAT